MARAERKTLIDRLEQLRGSKMLSYVTGDRAPVGAQIGDDAVRPIYEHLRQLGRVPKLDLFMYSRGGAIDVPWRLVSALRGTSDEWNILIPFRANSAATLIALGADTIIMGPQGELGPIDPIMNLQRLVPGPQGQSTLLQENVPVEDVMAYVRFVQQRGGLSDQQALAAGLMKLADRVDAVALGSVYRTHSHIRDVARRILLSRKDPATEQTLSTIIEMLAEKVYAHGHAISAKTAGDIGLPVEEAAGELDTLMWDLLKDYEEEMKLLTPLDPAVAVATTDLYAEESTVAIVESALFIHRFRGKVEIRAKRQVPAAMNVAVNLNIQIPALPAGAAPSPALQQMLAQLQPAIVQAAQQAVQDALKQQAPIAGIEAGFRGGTWVRSA